MGIEIERKFFLSDDSWRQSVYRTSLIAQAYLNNDQLIDEQRGEQRFSTRVRLQSLENAAASLDLLTTDDTKQAEANFNIKTADVGMQRNEYTYPIALKDAQELFQKSPWRVYKKRHYIKESGLIWEIDEFLDQNQGLIIAEVEIESKDQVVELPAWIGLELTNDQRYYNHALASKPYCKWVTHIEIDSATQILKAFNKAQEEIFSYSISTAANGLGEEKDSNQTPRGLHQIRAKIGHAAPLNAVFTARRPTGEIYCSSLLKANPDRDWILTRILWLSGLEPGRNRLGNVDTMQRYIYIHGAPENDSEPFGQSHSHGCVRMRSEDIVELFEYCYLGTTVMIN